MSELSRKNIQAFGKVLKAIGDILEQEPDNLFKLLQQKKGINKHKQSSIKDKVTAKMDDVDLYTFAKQHSLEEMVQYLKQYDAKELKQIIKKYSLGYTKLKSIDSISQYIADQFKKRTTDVFRTHEK